MLQCTIAGGQTKGATHVMRDLLFSSTNMAAMTSHENHQWLSWQRKCRAGYGFKSCPNRNFCRVSFATACNSCSANCDDFSNFHFILCRMSNILNFNYLKNSIRFNRRFSRSVIAAVLVDVNKRCLISSFCSSTSSRTFNKLMSVFHASVLLLIIDFAVDPRGDSRVNPQTTLTML